MKKVILVVLIIICAIVAFTQMGTGSNELPKCDAKETKNLIFDILSEHLAEQSSVSVNNIKSTHSLDFLSTKELTYNDTKGAERRTCYAEVSLLDRVSNEKESDEIHYTIIFGKNRSEFYVEIN